MYENVYIRRRAVAMICKYDSMGGVYTYLLVAICLVCADVILRKNPYFH